MTHLGKSEMADFLAGRLEEMQRRRVVEHLLAGCGFCRRRMAALARLHLGEEPWTAAEPVAEERYEEALARVRSTVPALLRRWRQEREKLGKAAELLEQAPAGLGDERWPRDTRSLHGWPLCQALLRKSREMRFTQPGRMLDLAGDAAAVAGHTLAEKYDFPGLVFDLRAEAFAELGNAYRLNYRFAEAEKEFGRALESLEAGTGNPLLEAQVLDLKASLRSDQRRLEDAIALLDCAEALYFEAGDPHLAGRARISKGFNTYYLGHPREAVGLFQEGRRLLDPVRDPQLQDSSALNFIYALVGCGEYGRASELLLRSGLRQAFTDEPLNLLKLRWVEGSIHAGCGRLRRAERIFSEARREFLRLDRVYDAALVGLELAAVRLRLGRPGEVLRLAEEMFDTFEDLGVEREAARALHFIREACRLQVVTVPMVEGVREFLERLPWHAGLRFQPELYAP